MEKSIGNQIVQIGIELIRKKGYNHVGLQEILATAKVPKGSFYYYFKSKEDFGIKVIEQYSKNSLKILLTYVEDTSKPSKERMISFFTDMRGVYKEKGFSEGCLLGNCSLELSDLNENFAGVISKELNQWQLVFEECIAEGQKDKSILNQTNAQVLGGFVLNSWEGALLRMKADKTIKALDDFIEIIHQLLS